MTQSFRPGIDRILIELGETNMRCALMRGGGLDEVRLYKLADHASLAAAVRFYCAETAFTPKARMGLIVALTAHLQNGEYFFKHSKNWTFRPEDLIDDLNLASIHFLNDVESHAYAVLGGYGDRAVIREGVTRAGATIALVSPGSGLGFSFIHPQHKLVVGTFGAHMHFKGLGPDDDVYKAMLPHFHYKEPIFENVVSGIGLKLMVDTVGQAEADHYFARVLGLYCHYMVLFGMAGGGLVFTGGLLPALIAEKRLHWDTVQAEYAIHNVQSVTDFVHDVPWHMVDDPHLGLKGLLSWAEIHIDT